MAANFIERQEEVTDEKYIDPTQDVALPESAEQV